MCVCFKLDDGYVDVYFLTYTFIINIRLEQLCWNLPKFSVCVSFYQKPEQGFVMLKSHAKKYFSFSIYSGYQMNDDLL